MTSTGTAADRWRELQEARGIPPEILAQAPETPWKHNPEHFRAPATPDDTPSRAAAMELLDQGPGATVLDVGCGGGTASLAVADHENAARLVGVDHNPGMLKIFAEDCEKRGVEYRTVRGEWPAVADEAGIADVVLCHHVGYNTPELPPFLIALTAAARRGVVMELTAQHPMAWADPLWLRFHGLRRLPPATADDAADVLRELGIEPKVIRWERAARLPEDPVWVAGRLCLPPERVPEVAEALAEIPPKPRCVVTLTW